MAGCHEHRFGENLIHASFGWKKVDDFGEQVLEGYVRCKTGAAKQLADSSGEKGMFVNRLVSPTEKPPHDFWIQRLPDESIKAYYERASKEMKQEKCPRPFAAEGATLLVCVWPQAKTSLRLVLGI